MATGTLIALGVICLAALLIYALLAVQDNRDGLLPQCPHCGSRYLTFMGRGKWLCRVCGRKFKGN